MTTRNLPDPGAVHLCDIGAASPCHLPCRIISIRKASWQYLATVQPLQPPPAGVATLTEIPVASRVFFPPMDASDGLQLSLI